MAVAGEWCLPRRVFCHLVTVLFVLSCCAEAFNVDVSSKVIHTGPRGSCDQECMFGFAVAQHREKGTPW